MIILKTCCNGKCTQPLIYKTDDVCLTELPAFVLSRTAKQTAPRQSAGPTSSPGPSPRRFSKWRIDGRRPWARLESRGTKSPKNLGDFYHVTFWEKPKQNGGEGEAKHQSKDALTLYTRQRWLRSKIKYYFNGCFDSGAGIFSICKFIPLSYSLYFW